MTNTNEIKSDPGKKMTSAKETKTDTEKHVSSLPKKLAKGS